MDTAANKYAYIDIARGIAILMVILVHTSHAVKGLSSVAESIAMYGQMGVQLFFLVSAYTLSMSWVRRNKEPKRYFSFYVRRFFRIAPLYYIGIILYFFIHIGKQWIQGQSIDIGLYNVNNILANIFLIHGLVPDANNSIVPGGWSIGAEVLFYVIFPFLFAGLLILKRINNYLFWLSPVLAWLAAYLLQATFYPESLPLENNKFMYFNILNQLPVFLLGIVLLDTLSKRYLGRFEPWVYLVAFAFISICAMFLWDSELKVTFSLMPIVSAFSFVFLLLFLQGLDGKGKFLAKVGQVSYSMYVFHFVFAVYLIPICARVLVEFMSPDAVLLLCYTLVVALVFPVAVVSELWIERKGILYGSKLLSLVKGGSGSP